MIGNQVREICFKEHCKGGDQMTSLCVSLGEKKKSYAIPSSHVVRQLLKLLLIFIRAAQSQQKGLLYKQDLLRNELKSELGSLLKWERRQQNSTENFFFSYFFPPQMIHETSTLLLPVAGFLLVFIQSIECIYVIFTSFQLKFLLSPTPKRTVHMYNVYRLFNSPKEESWPWATGLSWPCCEQGGWTRYLRRSSLTSAVGWSHETFNDFILFVKLEDGTSKLPISLWYFYRTEHLWLMYLKNST